MKDALFLLIWLGLWSLGGIWLAGAAFRLERGARLLVGLAVGLALENLLANLLARMLPFPAALWTAAALTALTGLVLALRGEGLPPAGDGVPRWKARLDRLSLPLAWRTLACFAALSLLCFALGRGFGLFDDFAHLPVISLMAATGQIPPRFPLNPAVPYEYHYFLLFSAAQAMRAGDIPPWGALDLMRGLASGLALCLAFYWTRRVTHSSAAGLLGAVFLFFASGARWLLLFLPRDWLLSVSSSLQMLGSGAASGPDLSAALSSPWAVEGAGPIPFPFAFANGVVPPGVLLQFVANGLTEHALVLALLLAVSRRRGWVGHVTAAILLSPMALLSEAGIVLELGGLGLVALITALRRRSRGQVGLPRSLWVWLAIAAGGQLLSSWQGSALWNVLWRAVGINQAGDYHSIGFQFVFPPTVVSSHLGVLSLGSPIQALIALAEVGPLLLGLPLLFAWGLKAARAGRWYEASLAAGAFLSLGALFIQFTGSEGIRNTSRLYRFNFILVLFAVPLFWTWLKGRPAALRWGSAGLAGTVLLGGLGIFAVQLPALQKPVYTYFVTEMDAQIYTTLWNRLEPGALVFDLVPYRAATLLGRYTDSNTTWYALKPEWKTLFLNPLPAPARAYGFDYAYMDNFNFAQLAPAVQRAWEEESCARLVQEARYEGFWRRLYDIRDCR